MRDRPPVRSSKLLAATTDGRATSEVQWDGMGVPWLVLARLN